MAGKGSTFDNDFLKMIFNATPIANLADNTATSPATTLTFALHTADPGAGGNQSTNEIAYTGYARVAVARSSAGWTVTGASVSPAASIDFPVMTGGAGGTVTHISVGTGTGNNMLWYGAIAPTIIVSTGVTPRLGTSSTIVEA